LLEQSADECVAARDFELAMQRRLADLHLRDWATGRSPGILDGTCVAFGFVTSKRSILLVSALRGRVKAGLQLVAEETYRRCFTKKEVTSKVEAVLRANGEVNWEIRNDAPVGGPIDRLDAIVEHVKAGCFVYSGTGMSDVGERLYFVVGPP